MMKDRKIFGKPAFELIPLEENDIITTSDDDKEEYEKQELSPTKLTSFSIWS